MEVVQFPSNLDLDNLQRSSSLPHRTAIRVVRVLTRPNLGGPTRQAIALWHAGREIGMETLLVTGTVGPDEVELSPSDHGVPTAPIDGSASGWLQVPDLRRGLSILGDRRATRALRGLIRAFRPDVVHTHTSKAGLIGRKAAWAERVPITAHTFHGHVLKDYFGRLPSKALATLERRMADKTDVLFAISQSCADELAECRVAARSQFVVTPPAVATPAHFAREEARCHLSVPLKDWRVCAVGRLVPIKRLDHYVAAVGCVPELRGDIIGEGPERMALQRLADQKSGGRVLLRGAVANIAQMLPAYDCLVLSSVREGCPLVAIEAFAAGVPVVGYDVPGVRDALSDFGRGILVPVSDGPAGLARALSSLHDDPALQLGWIRDAERAVELCKPTAVAGGLLKAYRQALAR